MKLTKPLVGLALASLILPFGSATTESDALAYKTARMEYRLHSRDLGDVGPALPTDTKLHILLSGKAAKDVFDHLRKDKYDACTAGQGIRVRAIPGDGLVCVRYADGEYSCGMGVDMKAGKLTFGLIC